MQLAILMITILIYVLLSIHILKSTTRTGYSVLFIFYFIAALLNVVCFDQQTAHWSNMILLWAILLLAIIKAIQQIHNKTFHINVPLLCFFMLLIMLNINELTGSFRYDSYSYLRSYYYHVVSNGFVFEDISSLSLCGHISYAYTCMLMVVNSIIPNEVLCFHVLNLISYLSSVIYFFKIMQRCLPTSNTFNKLLFLSVFAFHPYIMGTMWVTTPDYVLFPLLLAVIYYMLEEKYVHYLVFSLLLIFTKEVGILFIFSCCFCKFLFIIYDTWRYRHSFKEFIAVHRNFIICGIVEIKIAFRWLYIFTSGNSWTGNGAGNLNAFNEFAIDFSHIAEKIKVIFIFNYSWLIEFLIIITLLFYVKQKKHISRMAKQYIIMIFAADMANIIFNFLFITYNHSRYISIHCIALVFCLGILVFNDLLEHRRKILLRSTVGILSVLLFIQNYITLDPVMLLTFPGLEGHLLVSSITPSITDKFTLTDAAVYNKQLFFLDKAIDKSLQQCDIHEGDTIFLPDYNVAYNAGYLNSIYSIWGQDYYVYNIFWDEDKRILVPPDIKSNLNVTLLSKAESGQSGYLLVPSWLESDIDSSTFTFVSSTSYMGWKINIYKLEVL